MANPRGELPPWVDLGLIPLLNLVVALLFAGLVVLIIGENPLAVGSHPCDVRWQDHGRARFIRR